MKKLSIILVSSIILLCGCADKKLKQSFLDYRLEQSMGIKMDHKILEFEVLNTVTNKEAVADNWKQIYELGNMLTPELLDKFLIQENDFRNVEEDYYEFAKKHKGASEFIDAYLLIMEKSLNIKKQGIDNSLIADKVEIISWFINRKNKFYGKEEIIIPLSINEIKNIESIINGEEQDEYFRVRIKYVFKNPLLNNTEIQLEEIYHYNMNGKCISVEENQ